MLDSFSAWAEKGSWIIEKLDEPISFPESLIERYGSVSEDWLMFYFAT